MLKITNYEAIKEENEKKRKTGADRERCEYQKEGEMEKVFDGRTQQQKEGGREGGRETEAAQFMPLSPCSKDSSLGGLRL